MAQALFDEHPLEEYLRGAGESLLSIPGISSQFEREIDPYFDIFYDDTPDEPLPDWRPQYLVELLEVLQSLLPSTTSTSTSNPFVEKFKYNVISSSLLSPSLPAPQAGRSSRTQSIPGKLHHSRASSMDLGPSISASSTFPTEPSYGTISFAIASVVLFFSIGYPLLTLISFFVTLFLLYHSFYTTETSKHDMTSSFNALDDLIVANEMWESVVQDAVTFLDNEERNHFQSSSGSSSPSSIRVAFHSCMQTTHTQCDNIRHLFSALTSPANLSQLSEMYAPPSPMRSGFPAETSSRPFSFPSPRPQSTALHIPTTPENKRSTWNGSYVGLAYTGSPPSSLLRRRDKRDKHRVHLSDIFRPASSAPTTPLFRVPRSPLPEVPEHSISEGLPSSTSSTFSPIPSHFGAAALELQRKRKTGGMEAFREPPANYYASDLGTPRSARSSAFSSTITSSSKFTNPQPARHPLSYSALTGSLQGALAAKRYTCSHLLALRFSDDEDDGYWEDVKSVMGLLSSTLTDSFSRLSDALDEVEEQKLRDQHPTPDIGLSPTSENEVDAGEILGQENDSKRRRSDSKVSFAPMPNHISRFAAHVAAISSALEDAKDDLAQCVASLKSDPSASNASGSSRRLQHSRSISRAMSSAANLEPEAEEPPALQAYERLRRELGLALRECERGRERLLELVNPPPIFSDEEEEFDDLPGLGHDASDDSDKPDPNCLSEDEVDPPVNAGRLPPSVVNAEGADGAPIDDATSHLLLTTSSLHLPMPGLEEVFEADTGAKVAFSKEKSKLSREERIKLAKARRESGMGFDVAGAIAEGDGKPVKMGVEKWGPGGEVVQELKDVIWKVNERKRMLADPAQAQPDAAPPPTSESS